MTTQPTAAPWKVTIERSSIEGVTVATIEQADDGPYRGMIARLQSAEHIDGISADEMTANAHLLGAAHDMFAALEGTRKRLYDAMIALGSSPEFADAGCHEADAALARARGQA